jgi:DNA-binding Lrp family transcriptional regulator
MNEPKAMDAIDKRILLIVQKGASLSIREIATQVGLRKPHVGKGYSGSMHRA